jgi:translation initiation factor 1
VSAYRKVYSTDGPHCRRCGHPAGSCRCGAQNTRPRGDGIARVSLDRKARRGKSVTIVTGVDLDDAALRKLGSELKRMCGVGGSVKDGAIEIQGDQRDRVVAELERRGMRVKRVGG